MFESVVDDLGKGRFGLMEYKKDVDRTASAMRCKEHLTLIDLLLSGQREAAADFMRLHLRDAAREKAEKQQRG